MPPNSGPSRPWFLPRDRQWSWVAIAISLGLHALLLLVRVGAWLAPRPLPDRIILVPLGTEGPRAAEMPFREPSGGAARRRPPTSGISALPRDETGPIPEDRTPPDTATVVADAPVTEQPGPPGDQPARAPGRVGPALGEGKLWVRPLPLPPQDLARAVTRTRAEIADSVVTAIVQAYLDSVIATGAANAPPPSWTTRIGEQQVGIDSRWIYLGPIKIPTALLALVMPSIGSAETSDFTKFRLLQQMREDVQIAARRSQTISDFKRAIRELRAQREQEREFAKNQRTAPQKRDSTATPPAPPPPPPPR
ncbi:MAG: hypothetical protein FJ206_07940 [Gemmatimonadetes bacterium]|nr:hypothetical protein [Gemmatimonadota bacterium]